jgi:hypothetical protein
MTIVDWIHNEFEEFDSKNFDGFGKSDESKQRKKDVENMKNEVSLIRSDVSTWADKHATHLSEKAETLPQRDTTIEDAITPREMLQDKISELHNDPKKIAQQRELQLISEIAYIVDKESADGGNS